MLLQEAYIMRVGTLHTFTVVNYNRNKFIAQGTRLTFPSYDRAYPGWGGVHL